MVRNAARGEVDTRLQVLLRQLLPPRPALMVEAATTQRQTKKRRAAQPAAASTASQRRATRRRRARARWRQRQRAAPPTNASTLQRRCPPTQPRLLESVGTKYLQPPAWARTLGVVVAVRAGRPAQKKTLRGTPSLSSAAAMHASAVARCELRVVQAPRDRHIGGGGGGGGGGGVRGGNDVGRAAAVPSCSSCRGREHALRPLAAAPHVPSQLLNLVVGLFWW
jgi:hypothetical protein